MTKFKMRIANPEEFLLVVKKVQEDYNFVDNEINKYSHRSFLYFNAEYPDYDKLLIGDGLDDFQNEPCEEISAYEYLTTGKQDSNQQIEKVIFNHSVQLNIKDVIADFAKGATDTQMFELIEHIDEQYASDEMAERWIKFLLQSLITPSENFKQEVKEILKTL